MPVDPRVLASANTVIILQKTLAYLQTYQLSSEGYEGYQDTDHEAIQNSLLQIAVNLKAGDGKSPADEELIKCAAYLLWWAAP